LYHLYEGKPSREENFWEDWGTSKDNIKMDGMGWIELPQDEVQ